MFFNKKEETNNKSAPVPASIPANTAEEELKDIVIHTMPDKFREEREVEADNNSKTIWFLGIAVLVALFGSIGYYFLTNQNKTKTPVVKEPVVEEKKEITETKAPSAKDTYAKYNAEFLALADMSAYESFIMNYCSQNRITSYQAERDKILALPESVRYQLLTSLKQGVAPANDFKNVEENINNSEAVLSITLVNDKKASVVLNLENNIWKLDREYWPDAGASNDLAFLVANLSSASSTAATSTEIATTDTTAPTSTIPTTDTPGVSVQSGLDTDSDRLMDKEELLLGTDINKSDSDGDGYNDYDELVKGYNPAGAGKLSVNTALASYKNSTYNYSLTFPAAWTMQKVDNDNSVIFLSPDGQFFQIAIQPNTNKQAIDAWYKEQFNVSDISPDQMITKTNGTGVKSVDGLNYYFTDNAMKFIIVISYNTGGIAAKDYPNLFEIFANSLALIKK